MMATRDVALIMSHNRTPRNKVFKPVDLMIANDNPLPIRNKVTTSAFFAIKTITSYNGCPAGKKVLMSMAKMKNRIK